MSAAALIASLALGTAAAPQAQPPLRYPERTDAPVLVQDKIILAGDSIMAPHSGWGGAFCAHRVHAAVVCVNLGRGGRSTRSYRAEGSWDMMLAEVRVPGYRQTYVVLGFAHNDGNTPADRWTEVETEFPANLRRQVAEVRAAGAVPILSTPLARRVFNPDGSVVNAIAPYAEAIRRVAAETETPLIDLNHLSTQLFEARGKAWSDRHAQRLPDQPPVPLGVSDGIGGTYAPQMRYDNVHLGRDGADFYAALMARELGRLFPDLRPRLVAGGPPTE